LLVLGVGDEAPDFSFSVPDGSVRNLASYRGRAVVVYFFPKANTSGCTTETRGFADLYPELQKAGWEVIGVSVDSAETQARFAEKCGSRFPIVADSSREIGRKYGVIGLLGVAKRVTFLIGPGGRVEQVVEGLLPGPHLRSAKEWLHLPRTGSG
jgi:peroxiredoxin Q/BCP